MAPTTPRQPAGSGAPAAKAPARRRAAPAAAPSPWAAADDRQRQREAKRNAVLTTAAELFNERGFHATSLDDIAARLHVSKPTLYYYVKNKDEILLACVSKGLDMTLAGIEASRAAGGNALEQLRACMQVYAGIVMQPFGMCLIRVGDEEVPEPARTELRRLKSEIDLAFRRLVAQGGAGGFAGALRPEADGLRDRGRLELDWPLVPGGRKPLARADRAAVHRHPARRCPGARSYSSAAMTSSTKPATAIRACT